MQPVSETMMINGVLFMVLLLPGVLTQSIPTLSTCPTRTVTLPDSRGFYNVQHNSDAVSRDACELTIAYTSNVGSYALVEGVRGTLWWDRCPTSQVDIGGDNCCIDRGAYTTKRAESQQNTLAIETRTDEGNFTISVYLSVYTCGSSTNRSTPWTGVVCSLGGGAKIPQTDCFTLLPDLPAGAEVKVIPLKPLGLNEAVVSIGGQNSRVNVAAVGEAVYVNVTESGTINIRRTLDNPNEPQIGGFALVYTVIRCGDIPEIENTTHTPIQPPYLPGSTVQYSCGDNYHFKNRSYITCEEKIQGKAVWSDDVRCIPVPWCLKLPQNISRSTPTVVSVNRTISYECHKGHHESTYGPALIVTCFTTDEDRQPWRWNDTNINTIFQCNPGSLDNNTVAYNYGDTITYECDTGFKKNRTEPIRCLSDKSWSGAPGCDQVYCRRLPNTPNQLVEDQSNSTDNKLAYGEVITIRCVEGYKLRSQNLNRWVCSQSESWVSSNDDSIEYDEQLLPLCGKSDNSEENTDLRKGMAKLRSDISSMVIVSSVLGVVCLLLMIVIVVFIRLYNVTPKDIKQRIAKKDGKTDRFEAQGVENVRHNAAEDGRTTPDEYEDVIVGPAGVKISMNTVQSVSGKPEYEQISPRVTAAGLTYENSAYQGDQGADHEYAKLGQLT